MRYRAVMLASVLVGAIGVAIASPQIRRHLFASADTTVVIADPPRTAPAVPATSPGSGGVAGSGTDASRAAIDTSPIVTETGSGGDAGLTHQAAGGNTQSPDVTAEPTLRVKGTVFFGWSLLDRATDAITGSANRERGTNSTESMIKAWIASDYLRMLAVSGRTPTKTALHELTLMIIDSNDDMAQKYYRIDGEDSVVTRLISMCGLKHTRIYGGWWSKTQMTPADAVHYGECVADGRAAGKKWTPWILNTMTRVRGGIDDQQAKTGGGHWGIITALPPEVAATTSIKNGWTEYDGVWHVNCLAIQQAWVLSVMMRYPAGNGLKFGADACASVTRQLLGEDTAAHGLPRDTPD